MRDLDDPLTLVHLFALLPADKRHGIPNDVVVRSRSLALEFQSFITKTHALRKVFISVKVGTDGQCSLMVSARHVIRCHLT